jgi:hypothetical protein
LLCGCVVFYQKVLTGGHMTVFPSKTFAAFRQLSGRESRARARAPNPTNTSFEYAELSIYGI